MPASKKRVQNARGTSGGQYRQSVPAALRKWAHIWHGVRIAGDDTFMTAHMPIEPSSPSNEVSPSFSYTNANLSPQLVDTQTPMILKRVSIWLRYITKSLACKRDDEPLCTFGQNNGPRSYQNVKDPSSANSRRAFFRSKVVHTSKQSLFPSLQTIENPRKRYKDSLYVLLNMRWPLLTTVLSGVFIVTIIFFTLIFQVVCGEPSGFLEAFDLTYQTFSTIGFGVVSPLKTCANMMSVVVSFWSMLITSAITGLVFAKFAKPKAKVAFSRVCVVQPYGKKYLALVVRVANATQSRDITHDVIMEANFKLNLLRIEKSSAVDPKVEDHSAAVDRLCSYNLRLLQNNFVTFRMGVAVVHIVDEQSPLYGMTRSDLLQSDMILEVGMAGVDSTLQDTVTERHVYTARDVRWGYRFAELLDFDEVNAEVVMDFEKLSKTYLAPIEESRYVTKKSQRSSKANGDPNISQSAGEPINGSTRGDFPIGGIDVESRGRSAIKPRRASVCRTKYEGGDQIDSGSCHPYYNSVVLRRYSRSASLGSSVVDTPIQVRKQSKCSFAMEPLFESLLKPSVGTQRLPKMEGVEDSSQRTHRNTPTIACSGRIRQENSATDDTFLAPSQRQKKKLQSQLAGDATSDDEEDQDDDEDDENDAESTGDIQDSPANKQVNLSRTSSKAILKFSSERGHSHSVFPPELPKRESPQITRSRAINYSNVSVDVQDTPRFVRIRPIRIPKSYSFMRLYHSALYERWPRIIVIMIICFLGINTVFAILYWLDRDAFEVSDALQVTSFEKAFYMSVHTLSTVGYGSVAPTAKSVYLNLCVMMESVVGLITVTIITGIAWSKFARPRAHIHFSSNIIISTFYGHRCLMFRAANTRHSGDVHENFFRIGVILTNRKTGLRQVYDVPLVTPEWPSIKLPATLIHIIDIHSPFYRFNSTEDLSSARVALIALMTGLDTTFAENVYARKMYFWDDFAFDQQFADFATISSEGIHVNFRYFDQLVPFTWQEQDEHEQKGELGQKLGWQFL